MAQDRVKDTSKLPQGHTNQRYKCVSDSSWGVDPTDEPLTQMLLINAPSDLCQLHCSREHLEHLATFNRLNQEEAPLMV